MNKTAIKNFAIWARNKLIADITYKAGLLGITERGIKNPLPQSTYTVQFFDIGTKEPYSISGIEIEQRKKLVEEIQRKANQSEFKTAYKNVVEEVAYTWFNRLIAIRFMEVNDYLPIHLRVLSSESSNKAEPDLVTHPLDANLDYTPYEKDRIMQLKNNNKLDELFRMLFIKQCNALNDILPELFEKTSDYTELLLNVSFADQDGVVYHLVNDIPEDNFDVAQKGQVEIIGWMYQYYNTEPKNETFALLKKNVKITKERIPAATQLFTPDWIIRYMVENSLGRLWLEGHPNETLKSKWKYYLDEAEQEAEVQKQLDKIREEYKKIKPEEIKIIDPCMGSGHILVYAFEVLMQIYESCGYSQGDAAKSIIENNLYGLDIDNRAYQFAYFAVMMKARQYNRQILNGENTCHVYAIQESNSINRSQLKYFSADMSEIEKNTAILQVQSLLNIFIDAKEYGSILNVGKYDWKLLHRFVRNVDVSGQMTMDTIGIEDAKERLQNLVEIGEVMSQKYDVVVTNPPYMGMRNMNDKLTQYVMKQHSYTKNDLYGVMFERALSNVTNCGYVSMITQHIWMFTSGFEKFRSILYKKYTIASLVHLGTRAFEDISGEVVQVCAFSIKAKNINNYKSRFVRLVDFGSSTDKEINLHSQKETYYTTYERFSIMPGIPMCYWLAEKIIHLYKEGDLVSDVSRTRQGLKSSDDKRFFRMFFEVDSSKIANNIRSLDEAANSDKKWFYLNKGGMVKWFGNNLYLINWENDGQEIKDYATKIAKTFSKNITAIDAYFKHCISWSQIAISKPMFRFIPDGFIFASAGPSLFVNSEEQIWYMLGLLNSKITSLILDAINPTVNFGVSDILKIPFKYDAKKQDRVSTLVKECIEIARNNWDSYELSWNYARHPILSCQVKTGKIADAFEAWEISSQRQRLALKSNEEDINRIFLNIYGLAHEIDATINDTDITFNKPDLSMNVKYFISYAVGCMFGRYSLDVDGLAYAGGEWDGSKYRTFIPDKDSILPITDEEYFKDDVVGLFCAFLKKTFGAETLEENLDFIAKALGNKGNSSREIIRNYFLKDFFKDHCKVYQKRPIYWMFDSGKADGFKALVYMHRYNEDTIGKLRIDYLHRMQRIYESEISRMQETIENSKDAREVTAATKRKEKLVKQLKETKEYDEKIAHLALARIAIDLDDGVKVNYEKVQTDTDGKKLHVLAKI